MKAAVDELSVVTSGSICDADAPEEQPLAESITRTVRRNVLKTDVIRCPKGIALSSSSTAPSYFASNMALCCEYRSRS
jgi:hypothetical protein